MSRHSAKWLPVVTAITFVSALAAMLFDPARALVLAVLFLACSMDPDSRG